MRIFPIDKTLKKIFDEAEEEFSNESINRDQIKEIFYLFWYNTRQLLKSNKFPTIIFPKWGRFVPNPRSVKRLRDRLRNQEKDHKYLNNVIDRLNNEKQKKKRNAN